MSDSTFISDVRNIDFRGNKYYVSDNTRGQLLELDSAFRVIGTYGSLGNKPGEMQGVTKFDIFNDTIFAINSGRQAIECFIEGSPASKATIKISEELIGTRFDLRFVVTSDRIFLAAPYSGKAIASISRHGLLKEKFIELKNYDSSASKNTFFTAIRNLKSILKTDDNNLISISDVDPAVQFISMNGDILKTYQIDEYQPIDERLDYVLDQPKADYTTFALFSDVYYSNKKLYLLCITGKVKTELSSNRMLVFGVSDSNLMFEEELKLPGRWYTSFCVKGNHILAFETSKDELHLIKI